MGQRLVITVEKNDEILAKIYYHWSAYTISALYETKRLLEGIENCSSMTNRELQLQLIRFCEECGGGIEGGTKSEEFNWISRTFPDKEFKRENIDRNEGLIAISSKGMRDIQMWSEGDIIINLDTCKISNWVHYLFSNIEEYNSYRKEAYEDDEGLKEEDITEIEYNLDEISIYDLDDVIDELENLRSRLCRSHGHIYELID